MTTAHDFTLPRIGGGEICLRDFAGEAILLVNTASECGYTPQYKDLEALWRERKGKGTVVLGVPSNDFGAQEPGSETEIRNFCERNYGVTFPMTEQEFEGYLWTRDRGRITGITHMLGRPFGFQAERKD